MMTCKTSTTTGITTKVQYMKQAEMVFPFLPVLFLGGGTAGSAVFLCPKTDKQEKME